MPIKVIPPIDWNVVRMRLLAKLESEEIGWYTPQEREAYKISRGGWPEYH